MFDFAAILLLILLASSAAGIGFELGRELGKAATEKQDDDLDTYSEIIFDHEHGEE